MEARTQGNGRRRGERRTYWWVTDPWWTSHPRDGSAGHPSRCSAEVARREGVNREVEPGLAPPDRVDRPVGSLDV